MSTKSNKAQDLPQNTFDLAFIGSGIATSFTILGFIEKLMKTEFSQTVKVALIDQYPEFHAGIPYGTRSGNSSLLITSLEDFIPEPERAGFLEWLNENKEWILKKYEEDGGILTKSWLTKHKNEIAQNQWNKIFVPRRFFGWYIAEKVEKSVALAEERGLIKLSYINLKVNSVVKDNNQYLISGDDRSIKAGKVVLGIGSPPPKKILPAREGVYDTEDLLLISNPYKPGISENLNKINTFLEKRSQENTNILIIGANASALEMIYKINDVVSEKDQKTNFIFISSLGMLPDSVVNEEALRSFQPTNLLALKEKENILAEDIAEATYADLDDAEELNIGAATSIKPISKAFGDLLAYLSPEELERFACLHGNEIGRRQRCAGTHYSDVVKELAKIGLFRHIAGRYESLEVSPNGDYQLKYLPKDQNKSELDETPLHIVINCIGNEILSNENITPLYGSIMKSGIARPNSSLRGFEVNQDLEASDNFHVIGPLLAGNVIEGKALWHLEHCGRIIWSSKHMAGKLLEYYQKHKQLAMIK